MDRGEQVLGLSAFAAGLSLAFSWSYVPPKVWQPVKSGGAFAAINRPTAGPRTKAPLPRGKHALQLHSLGTPNGVKVTALLEELAIKYGLEYDAWTIGLSGDQFGDEFTLANPNSKIPALLHFREGEAEPIRVFESAAIIMYLTETFDTDKAFMPTTVPLRAECVSWVFWLQGSAPYVGGGFGHFFAYAPEKFEYPINRFTMETKRQLSVLDRHLGGLSGGPCAGGPYIIGDQYTIADMTIWPWFGALVLGRLYSGSAEFLSVHEYPHVMAWAKLIDERLGVKRGRMVNRTWDGGMKERHSVSDFDQYDWNK